MKSMVSRIMTRISGAATVPTRKLAGAIVFTSLPPHFGIIVRLQLFPVSGPDAPIPYDGDPPADAATDSTDVCEQVDLQTEIQQPTRIIPYSLKRPTGYYYVQVRTVLFRKNTSEAEDAAKFVGQLEPFFFARSPLALLDDLESVELAIEWPSVAIEDMGVHAKFRPGVPPTAPQ